MFPIHRTFPKEMAIIGRLLVDYGELELDLMNCIQVIRGYDLNSTLKAMFGVRGELNRITIGKALGESHYSLFDLNVEFKEAVEAMDRCRKIRNKYAHAYWHDPNQGKSLCYVSLEELAEEPAHLTNLDNLTFFFIDEALLLTQEQYFEYARYVITYVNFEGRYRAKLIAPHNFSMPKQLQKPLFYSRRS